MTRHWFTFEFSKDLTFHKRYKARKWFVPKCFVSFAQYGAYSYRRLHIFPFLLCLDFVNFEGFKYFEYNLSACSSPTLEMLSL